MISRKELARKGIRMAHKAASRLGLGDIGRSALVGAGSALGASVPYLASGLALQILGFKKAGAVVYILGSFDTTGLDVLMIEGDQLNPDREDGPKVDFNTVEPNKDLIDWYEKIVEEAYREAKG